MIKKWCCFIEMRSFNSAYAVVKQLAYRTQKHPYWTFSSVLHIIFCVVWVNSMLWTCLTCSPGHPWHPVWSRRVVGGAPRDSYYSLLHLHVTALHRTPPSEAETPSQPKHHNSYSIILQSNIDLLIIFENRFYYTFWISYIVH